MEFEFEGKVFRNFFAGTELDNGISDLSALGTNTQEAQSDSGDLWDMSFADKKKKNTQRQGQGQGQGMGMGMAREQPNNARVPVAHMKINPQPMMNLMNPSSEDLLSFDPEKDSSVSVDEGTFEHRQTNQEETSFLLSLMNRGAAGGGGGGGGQPMQMPQQPPQQSQQAQQLLAQMMQQQPQSMPQQPKKRKKKKKVKKGKKEGQSQGSQQPPGQSISLDMLFGVAQQNEQELPPVPLHLQSPKKIYPQQQQQNSAGDNGLAKWFGGGIPMQGTQPQVNMNDFKTVEDLEKQKFNEKQ